MNNHSAPKSAGATKGLMRLDALLSQRGYSSRRDVPRFLREHSVILKDDPESPLKKGDLKVHPAQVLVDGAEVDAPQLYLVMNKPLGMTCSHQDKGPLVYDVLPDRYRERSPLLATIGRLDKETTGIILLSDDGDLNHRLTSPKKKVPKVYRVLLDRPVSSDELAQIEQGGMMLESETTPLLPAEIKQVGAQEVELTIWEGRYHQVRRTFAALGNHVNELHRTHFAGLGLGSLELGSYRHLTAEELAEL
jgi:16S rRNA pseudouridine516 synthase